MAFAIDPASRDDFSKGYKVENEENSPVKWQLDQTLVQFIQSAFAATTPDSWPVSMASSRLRAWKLKHRYGIQIVPTNDLIQHLMYNPRHRTLSVFHQVEYLKAHVQHSAERSLSETVEMSLKKFVTAKHHSPRAKTDGNNSGTLPPQLLLETLQVLSQSFIAPSPHLRRNFLPERQSLQDFAPKT